MVPEPSWKVKTRSCPFYQKGRCLFNDSCNFIHDASASTPESVCHPVDVGLHEELTTPQNLPQVIIGSPSTPNRSPRTTSLLLALKDVIGESDDEISPREPTTSLTSWSESLPTLVNEGGFEQPDVDAGTQSEADRSVEEGDDMFEASWTAISDYSDQDEESHDNDDVPLEPEEQTVKLSNFSLNRSDGPPLQVETSPSLQRRSSTAMSGLLSPIELSTLHLGPFRRGLSRFSTSESSFDLRNWKTPKPFLPSPPRSPSIASTFELFSSPFGSHSTRILSPRLGIFMPSSPVKMDSPEPLQEIEMLDLGLDSPRELNVASAISNLGNISTSWNNRVQDDDCQDDSAENFSENDDEFILQESTGHPSLWDPEDGETAVYVGVDPEVVREQVSDALKSLSATPTHFLTSQEISFTGNDVLGSSSFMENSSPQVSLDEDVCVTLPRTLDSSISGTESTFQLEDNCIPPNQDSPLQPETKDNFNSLYDIYSGIASPIDVLADSIQNTRLSSPQSESAPLSSVSTPVSLLRERVFTPPIFGPGPSGAASTGSQDSATSPLTSLDSASGRASPFSPQDDKAFARSLGNESISQKVTLASRSRSALSRTIRLSNQSASKTIPPSTLDQDAGPSIPKPQSVRTSTSSTDSSKFKGLKPLRLSSVLSSQPSRSLFESHMSNSYANSFRLSRNVNRTSASSASVSSSNFSSSNNLSSSASRSSFIPLQNRDRSSSSGHVVPPLPVDSFNSFPPREPLSAPLPSRRDSSIHSRQLSLISGTPHDREGADDSTDAFRHDAYDETLRQPPHTAPVSRTPSNSTQLPRAIETPRPTLMFAIASDDVEQVKQVLQSGEVNPNEAVGPHSALAFTLTNDKLSNKLEIVKALLAYGADPDSVRRIKSPGHEAGNELNENEETKTREALVDELDHATRYFIERAGAKHTRRSSALIQRSFFRPLTRVRYELIGQDRALEQLFRVLSMRSRELTVAPIVVLLCGPSGHGKSLLARRFGTLLDVPTHTVNITTLRSSHDLWQSYSMSPYEETSNCTLAEFLINNEGRKCVVILDEIEKTGDERILWSLYMPWELGRCALESSGRHVDVRNVIWLGTSNIGHDIIFQHQESRNNPEEMMSREEYLEIMGLLRPKVSERLGPSVLSRVTTVIPFVPFTLAEKKAICAETLCKLGGDSLQLLDSTEVESLIDSAIAEYYPAEGVRSLYRAISNQLLDIL